MPDHLGGDMRKLKKEEEKKEIKEIKSLEPTEIAALKSYNAGPYTERLSKVEKDIQALLKNIAGIAGEHKTDTGLAPQALWDLPGDVAMQSHHDAPLYVARILNINEKEGATRYMIQLKGHPKFLVNLAKDAAPTDFEQGTRVGVDRTKYEIQIPLPPKVHPRIAMMEVEEKPDITYADIGGCKKEIARLREVVEMPLLHPERFVDIGIEPPKGVLFYGPPGTGKTLCARAVANRTDACFILVNGTVMTRKYVGEGARLVRELFKMAKTKKACIIFFDEIDAIGGTRFTDGAGGDNEVQRTMLELVNQLDGFDSRGTIKVLMATNRPDTLDPALIRPGRIDRRIEFSLPDLGARTNILKIHTKRMSVDRSVRFALIARLCPNTTGADLRSVCTEAGMFALRARRKVITEKDMLDAVQRVVKGYAKFSSTPSYMTHN